MADSPETRVLKDINRHLADIKDRNDTLGETMSPSEKSAFNQNMQETMQNFGTLLDVRLKKLVLESDRKFAQTFGDLKGFNAAQTDAMIAELDDVIMSIEQSNRLLDKQFENQFLEEKQRETDLNINRRTNDLLEDLIDAEEESAEASASAESKGEGFLKGIFGGLFAGRGLAGLLGGVKALGKKLFFPALIALSGAEFLRGWAEAGEDASVRDKFNSAIGKTLQSLTFGLVPKSFFVDVLNSIEDEIARMWGSFKDNWKKFVEGEITGADFAANLISDLTMGALSPEQIKKIGDEIAKGLGDLIETLFDAIWEGFMEVTIDALISKFDEIISDPVGFLKRKWDEYKDEAEKLGKFQEKRIKELMQEGVPEAEAMRRAMEESIVESAPLGTQTLTKLQLKIWDKLGLNKLNDAAIEKALEMRNKRKAEARQEQLQGLRDRDRNIRLAREARKKEAEFIMNEKRLNKLRTEQLMPEPPEPAAPRTPDETGLFPPRPMVNAPSMHVTEREDTSTISDDRSLQLQTQN